MAAPGELVVDPPTLICLGFYWPVEGDDSHNAAATVEFRKKGEQAWRKGLNLWRTYGQMAGDGIMMNWKDFDSSKEVVKLHDMPETVKVELNYAQ